MFSLYLGRKCVLQFLDAVCVCQIYSVYSVVQIPCFLVDLPCDYFINFWQWGTEVSSYYCRTVYFSLQLGFCLIYFGALLLGLYMFINIFLLYWIFCQYITIFFVSCKLFKFKTYFFLRLVWPPSFLWFLFL